MEVSSRRVFPRVLMSWRVHVEDFCLEEHALFLSASLRSLGFPLLSQAVHSDLCRREI